MKKQLVGKTSSAIIFAAVLSATNSSAQTFTEYQVIDLGTLGGPFSAAEAINSAGQIVGSANISDVSWRAFSYFGGSMKIIDTGNNSDAAGINNLGQIVGEANTGGASYAFLYFNGAIKNLGTLGGTTSDARGINASGQIVGGATIARDIEYHPFLYSNGAMQDLGTFGGRYSYASAINNRGQIVGASCVKSPTLAGPIIIETVIPYRAFLYSGGSMQDLGTLGGGESHATAINENGQIAGYSKLAGNSDTRAFLFENGAMKNLGALNGYADSMANGINNGGQIVGNVQTKKDANGFNDSHAFICENGLMRDLNGALFANTGWIIQSAQAINDSGQIVGYGTNPIVKPHPEIPHALLLNPLPPGWRSAVATAQPQPTYGNCPAKELGKDSLIVVTHGWIPSWEKLEADWVDEMTNSISQYLVQNRLNNWQVYGYKWLKNANTVLPGLALIAGENEGKTLGANLSNQKWSHIHLIGFSAGAALIQSASETIKTSLSKNTLIHATFLDPYVGATYGGRSKYGRGADWSDNYFTRDLETSGEMFSLTEGPLDNAYNVDVTWLDQSKVQKDTFYSSSGTVIQLCQEATTTHAWPHEFYAQTIPPNTLSGANGFGFPMGKEGGNWDYATNHYRVGNQTPQILGTPDPSCAPSLNITTPAYIGQVLDFSATATASSLTGLIQNNGSGIVLTTSLLPMQRLQSSPPTIPPNSVWFSAPLAITNSANFVSLEAKFLSANAQGLLSVFWDTNAIGSVDERAVASELSRYTFALPTVATNGSHIISFRLDSFSNIVSSVAITNVSLGFFGIDKPFSLSFTGNIAGDLPVLQLTGPSGFNYTVESSANLIDWTAFAILVNTNGVVRFVDTGATNSPARFYRARGQ